GTAAAVRWRISNDQEFSSFPPEVLSVDEVNGMLEEREDMRRRREYRGADEVLKKVYTMPRDGRRIAVDDKEKRWTVYEVYEGKKGGGGGRATGGGEEGEGKTDREKCVEILTTHEPGKVGEVTKLLDKFEGKEKQILKRLRERYL
ncbi:hypothetical protein TrRE_jg11169, partial [Triparma retinervis]